MIKGRLSWKLNRSRQRCNTTTFSPRPGKSAHVHTYSLHYVVPCTYLSWNREPTRSFIKYFASHPPIPKPIILLWTQGQLPGCLEMMMMMMTTLFLQQVNEILKDVKVVFSGYSLKVSRISRNSWKLVRISQAYNLIGRCFHKLESCPNMFTHFCLASLYVGI